MTRLPDQKYDDGADGDADDDADDGADDDADVDADYIANYWAKIMIFQGTVSGRSTFERLGQPCFSFDCCCCCPKVISATFTLP